MQEEKYDELRNRSTDMLEHLFGQERAIAQQAVRSEMDKMVKSGEALRLSDEEERLLKAFRRFKGRMKKNGEVFKWQTRLSTIDEALRLVEIAGDEDCLLVDPQEVCG